MYLSLSGRIDHITKQRGSMFSSRKEDSEIEPSGPELLILARFECRVSGYALQTCCSKCRCRPRFRHSYSAFLMGRGCMASSNSLLSRPGETCAPWFGILVRADLALHRTCFASARIGVSRPSTASGSAFWQCLIFRIVAMSEISAAMLVASAGRQSP
jgi:hypothetical protein